MAFGGRSARLAVAVVLAVAVAMVVGPTAANADQFADSGSVTMTSDPGDWVGQGKSYTYTTSDSAIQTAGGASHLAIFVSTGAFSQWIFELSAPAGQTFGAGTTYTATRFPSATEAGMDVFGMARGCNTVTGTFTISTFRLGPAGYFAVGDDYLLDLDLTFEQHCEGGTAALHGTIHLVNQPAPPMTVGLSTTQPGPMARVDTLTFDAAQRPTGVQGLLSVYEDDNRQISSAVANGAGATLLVPIIAPALGLHSYTAQFTPGNASYPDVISAPVPVLVLSATPTLDMCTHAPNVSGLVTLTSAAPATAGTIHYFDGVVDLG